MGWATPYIEQLKQGKLVRFRPRGNSMMPQINSGDLCTVSPLLNGRLPLPGEVVLCKVNGREYLHKVSAVLSADPPRYLIKNNKGHVNGWTKLENIYGILIGIEGKP